MARPVHLTPKSKVVQSYYARLAELRDQGAANELHLRDAFQDVLADASRSRGWTLIPELETQVRGRSIVPDGTIRDSNYLPRGYWEAKDEKDDLDAEIARKIAKGYPTTNIIFEDTRRAVLYQDKRETLRVDLANPKELCELVNKFHEHVEPDIEDFDRAVDEFKERVPAIAQGLKAKIEEAHRVNPKFQQAFEQFLELCKQSLNPNIRVEAVDEMLIQHLLTERLFRTVFSNPDFVRRNVIAAEVESVIDALISQNFSKAEFLTGLNRFYAAIEQAAAVLPDFSEKQHFLNTVYERFFQGYSVKLADTHGIVYTPQPIVDFMVESVQDALRDEFGLELWSEGVTILDPCTGTGNFVVNILQRIPLEHIERVYKQQLFANEVMLLPYYIAALNIEHAYYERTGRYEPFEGLCFVDTLDLAERKEGVFSFMTEANTARVERQKDSPVTVIIGNPPYNVGQKSENDQNKNRKYRYVDGRIRDTYAADSKATLKSKLYDPYVRFIRWATDRLPTHNGILSLVTNNSFATKNVYDGMQKHLLKDYGKLWHVDLRGDVVLDPDLSGTQYNVFGIQVGVGITTAVKSVPLPESPTLRYARVGRDLRRHQKLDWLRTARSIKGIAWENTQSSWPHPDEDSEFLSWPPIQASAGEQFGSSPQGIFVAHCPGVSTNRDSTVYAFKSSDVEDNVRSFIHIFNSDIDRYRRQKPDTEALNDFFLSSPIKWSRDLKQELARENYLEYTPESIRNSLYRPFSKRFIYYARVLVDSPGHLLIDRPRQARDPSPILVISDRGYRSQETSALVTNQLPDLHLCASRDGHQCFPFFTYHSNEEGSPRENITDWALDAYRSHYADGSIGKWDVFYYVYALLHHRGYLERCAEHLKRELPRIPFAPDFWAFSKAGRELADWHIHYESKPEYPLEKRWAEGAKLDYTVHDKMRLDKTKTQLRVNPSLTLAGIPARAFDYRLGNRSALEWVIDQYQVKTHARSGIHSDPNRPDDPEYIVRLVGQVVQVSLETVRLVESLPADFMEG